jgi:hypothetical protein
MLTEHCNCNYCYKSGCHVTLYDHVVCEPLASRYVQGKYIDWHLAAIFLQRAFGLFQGNLAIVNRGQQVGRTQISKYVYIYIYIYILRLGQFFLHSLPNEKVWKLLPSGWAVPTRQKFTCKQRFERTSRIRSANCMCRLLYCCKLSFTASEWVSPR